MSWELGSRTLRRGYLAQELALPAAQLCREHPAFEKAGLTPFPQRKRTKLLYLSMVLQGANALALDEPTRNFSPLSAAVIREALASFPGCIISVSHDRLYLKTVCTRVLELGPDGLREW